MRWVNVTILLLVGVLGCQPGEQVPISGAVEKPGDYAYRPRWKAMDYVAAAGGFLPEADSLLARLIRVPADTTGEIHYSEIQKWLLNEVPVVMPGDQIEVPHLTYSVQMDTLREIRDLKIDWEGRTYHLSRGLVAPGWTERGVMTAVVLGHGKVTQKENGADRTLAGFRFLFLQMHPDSYEQILSAVEKPVQNREAMEDATEVYRFLFDRSAFFKTGNALRLAPQGYLRVLAGAWARPRTQADPGSGMRKQEYSDGRIWTTYPDGRQRMEYPDGRVEVEFPGQAKEIRYADGLVERLDSVGNRRMVHADGREVWVFKSGSQTTIYPDGRKLYEWPDGTRQTVLKDGTERTEFASGARRVLHPDGRREVIDSTGVREMHYPDGRVVAQMLDGRRVVRHPHRWEMARLPGGTEIETFPDGRRRWVSADPYRYGGSIRESLARIDSIPAFVAPRDRVILAGTVSDSVRRLDVAAFRVPDGHVIWETVSLKDGRFNGRIRMGDTGLYQVQVMADLGNTNVRTVMDRRVVVGNPEPIDTVVVESPPYPGRTRGAERLVALIDSVRMGMKRRRLQENIQLTHMAEDRLTEMIASGLLSHLSPTGMLVGKQLRDRQVTIFSVGENLGWGPSIEEVHWQLMMSAGHRRTLLSDRWNTVGVAVARAHDTVWVVELFGLM